MLNFHVIYEVLYPVHKCTIRLHCSGETTTKNIKKKRDKAENVKRRKVCAFFLDINEARDQLIPADPDMV